MTIKDFTDYAANFATIAALIFAGYQFLQWKKQQIYSIRISTLLDMEDRFEIYTMSSLKVFAGLNQAKKDASQAKTQDEKSRLNNFFSGEFREKILLATNESNKAGHEYSLYYSRAKRLNLDIENMDEINPEWLQKKFDSFIFGNADEELVANEASKIKSIAYDNFKKLRDKE